MDEIKTKKVKFSTGLPNGACATFKHDGELWFCYPKPKIQGLGVVMDRLVGTVNRLHAGVIDWLNRHPEDANRIVLLLGSVATTQKLALAKAEAWIWTGKETIGGDSTPTAEEAEADA